MPQESSKKPSRWARLGNAVMEFIGADSLPRAAMNAMNPAKLQLRQGDVLLYRPVGIFGRLIQVKTWHSISHVEVYDGNLQSVASRDGEGVDRYPLRVSELAYVLRPNVLMDFNAGHRYFDTMKGTPYGWFDLLAFVGVTHNFRGIVCSPFATGYLRACGWNVFPLDPIDKIAPFQFLDLVGPECSIAYEPKDLA